MIAIDPKAGARIYPIDQLKLDDCLKRLHASQKRLCMARSSSHFHSRGRMEKLRSFVGNTLGTGAVAVGLWVATVDHVAAATACLSAGVLILLIANINHFEFIKGFGFEARTKKLDEKIEEADRLFTQLKLASQLFADISVQVMSRTGRWAGPIPKSETQDLVTRIETLLKSFGVDQIGINKSLDPFHRIMLRGLAIPCIHAFFSELDRHAQLVNIAMGKRSADEQARTGLPIVADDPQYKALQNDWQVMQQFIKEMRQTLDNSDPFALGPLLEQSVADAPGWTDYERSAFLASIKKNIDEWKFYVKNLRLNDVPAWLAREWGH